MSPQKKKLTRKQEQRIIMQAVKELAETHKTERQIRDVFFSCYRLAVAEYFGQEFPAELFKQLGEEFPQWVEEGAKTGTGIDMQPKVMDLVRAFVTAQEDSTQGDAATAMTHHDLMAQTEEQFKQVMGVPSED